MPITNLGSINSLPDAQLPTGYTKPVVATFADFEYVRTLTLSVLKATVETASPATTLAAILNNATVGINKQITDIITADFLATPTVTSYAELLSLTTNFEVGNGTNTVYLTNAADAYIATVRLYVKAI